jgi:hypothetical protein
MHPEMIHGWWPKEIVRHLQIFYNDLIATLRKFWGFLGAHSAPERL